MRFIGNVNLARNHILRAGSFEIESQSDSISNDPALVREVLAALHGDLARLYAGEGRPSIPPEQLLGALLLQAFYGVRSERQLMEPLDYNLLFRWFVGLSPDEAVWVPTTFTKNRERSRQRRERTLSA